MKKNYILVAIIVFTIQFGLFAQDTIVQWTFPTQSGVADGGAIAANLSQIIETAGGTSDIQFKNGVTTKAAQATEWEQGANEKKWKVEFETTGYTNIKLSSKISSGGQNPGPRDFKVQYKADGSWIDIEESNFQTANNWTTGSLVNLAIPSECDDKALIKIRWIMTTDTATNGSVVETGGISKIDDIFVVGDFIDGQEELTVSAVRVYPNPTSDFINIATSNKSVVSLFDITGKEIVSAKIEEDSQLDVSEIIPGIYFVRVVAVNSQEVTTTRIIIK